MGRGANGSQGDDLVRALRILVPTQPSSSMLKYTTNSPVFLNTGPASGYLAVYQNTTPDNPVTGANGDQGHHFAAFFEFGYHFGALAGTGASAAFELFEAAFGTLNGTLNMGDIQLGITASALGADLKAGRISADQVGLAIQDSICKN
jgi:hypothetical protein